MGFFCIHFSRTAKNEEEQQSSTWIQEKSLLTLDLFQWNSLNLEFWLLSRPISLNSSPFNSMHFRHFYLSGISENRYSTKEFRHRKIKVIRAWMFAKKETAIHAQNKNVLVSTHWKQELYLNAILALPLDFGHSTYFSGNDD